MCDLWRRQPCTHACMHAHTPRRSVLMGRCCCCCRRCRVPAEGHVFAVRKLLETPNYGCKAVNLGELAALAQAWAQPHPVSRQADLVFHLVLHAWCVGVCLLWGLSAQPVLVVVASTPGNQPAAAQHKQLCVGGPCLFLRRHRQGHICARDGDHL